MILSGCSPFNAEEEEALLKLVAEAKYEFYEKEWANISAEAKDLIERCASPMLSRTCESRYVYVTLRRVTGS